MFGENKIFQQNWPHRNTISGIFQNFEIYSIFWDLVSWKRLWLQVHSRVTLRQKYFFILDFLMPNVWLLYKWASHFCCLNFSAYKIFFHHIFYFKIFAAELFVIGFFFQFCSMNYYIRTFIDVANCGCIKLR